MLISNTMFHTNIILASLARVSVTSTRTAEVTISIALDSYRTPSRHCIIQLVCAVVAELSVSRKFVKKGSASNETSPVKRLYDM